jgi:hypothetical protein
MPIYKFTPKGSSEPVQIFAPDKQTAILKLRQADKSQFVKMKMRAPQTDSPQVIKSISKQEASNVLNNMPSGGIGTQFLAGVNQGVANLAGLPVDLATAGINKVGGAFGMDPIENPFMGSQYFQNVMEMPQTLRGQRRSSEYQPQSPAERFARRGGEYAGASIIPGSATVGAARKLGIGPASSTAAGEAAAAATAAGLEQAAVEQVEKTEGEIPSWLQSIIGMGGAFIPGLAGGLVKRSSAKKQSIYKQTANDYKKRASNLYGRVKLEGKAIDPTSYKGLADDSFTYAVDEGFTYIDDLGRVSLSKDFNKSEEVLSTLKARDRQNFVTPAQAMADRKMIQNAIQDSEGPQKALLKKIWTDYEARIGTQLGDDFIEANKLWRTGTTANEILSELNLAAIKIDQGRDAYPLIQNRLSAILQRHENGREPFLTQSQVAAIKKASDTTTTQNIGRMLQQFGLGGNSLQRITSAGLPALGAAGAAQYTGDITVPVILGGAAAGQTVSSAGGAMARGNQSARVNKMIEEVLANPNIIESKKQALINAITRFYGAPTAVATGESSGRAFDDATIMP